MSDKHDKNCHCCGGSGEELDQAATSKLMVALRTKAGISQSEVARRMGLSNTHTSDLEGGNRNWNLELIERYKNACEQKVVVK